MKFTLAQLILIIVILLIVIFKIRGTLKKKETINSIGFFILFWVGIGIIVVFPNLTQIAANFLGIGRGVDLFIYLAIIILFSLFSMLLTRISEIDMKVTKLARIMTLSNPENGLINPEQKNSNGQNKDSSAG